MKQRLIRALGTLGTLWARWARSWALIKHGIALCGVRLGVGIMMKGDAGMNRKGKDRGSRYTTRDQCHIVTNNSFIMKFGFLSLYNVFDVLTLALSDCARLREGNPLGRNLTPHPDRMKMGPTDQLAQLAFTTR